MKEYTLVVSGCDDSTYLTLTLSPQEHAFLEYLCVKVADAGAGNYCAPTMYFEDDE
jgi:hypothetical protein